jgi:serine/threonine-protein phosphatase 2A regulatory subunit B''
MVHTYPPSPSLAYATTLLLMTVSLTLQVIARIYYCVNRSWSGRITLPELSRSNLLNVIQLLEEEEDINQVTAYFSYEHFYVIYCKFWELDRDHDLYIDKQDLTRHSDHGE